MAAPQDLTGQRFGQLTVRRRGPPRPAPSRASRWWCQCDCGSPEKLIDRGGLMAGQVVSCGCRLQAIQRAGALKVPPRARRRERP